MKVLIIEDEPRAANQLQKTLAACNFSYQLQAILDSVEEAVMWFQKNSSPDLVFMDIQLADGLSFEIFQKVEVDAPIIFTTAFDQYAIQAFKVNSIDYLLKPIKEADLAAALDKFQKSVQPAAVDPQILSSLLAQFTRDEKKADRQGILVKEGNGYVQLSIAEVLYFYSSDSVTFAVTSEKRYIVEETLDLLYATLNEQVFYRINRSQIVSRGAILKLEPYFNHRVILQMNNPRDQEFIVSRPKTTEFKAWMNG